MNLAIVRDPSERERPRALVAVRRTLLRTAPTRPGMFGRLLSITAARFDQLARFATKKRLSTLFSCESVRLKPCPVGKSNLLRIASSAFKHASIGCQNGWK